MEKPKGNFPSFIQKIVFTNSSLNESNINKSSENKNNTSNDGLLSFKGKSSLTKIKIDQVLIF